MAVTETAQPEKMLNPTMASLAGGVSIAILTATIATTVVYMALQDGAAAWMWVLSTVKVVAQCMLIIAAVQLIRGRKWAQQLLLIVWMVVLAEAFILLLTAILWGQPQWWKDLADWHMAAVVGPLLACSAVAATLLVMASRAGCRVRYASMVIVSIVIAMLAAVVVNMVAQDTGNYIRSDMGTLERYGISDRTRKLLASLDPDRKLTLTCVYTSEEEGKKSGDYRPRVWELIQEIQDAVERTGGKQVEVANVTTVAQKARLDARLRGKQLGGQAQHVKVLKDFLAKSESLSADLKATSQRWASMPYSSYMGQWGVAANAAGICRKRAEAIDQLAAAVGPKLTGAGLPDCDRLVKNVNQTLTDAKDALAIAARDVGLIRSIPVAVAKQRVAADSAMKDATDAVDAMMKTIAPSASTQPADPAKVLGAFTVSARHAAATIRRAADILANLAGKEMSLAVRGSRAFAHEQRIETAFGPAAVRSDLVAVLKDYAAKPLESLASHGEGLVKNAKSSFQAEAITQYRKELAGIVKLMTTMRTKATAAIATLATVDKPTQDIFDRAGGGSLFASVLKPITSILDRIAKLPEITESTLTRDVAEENIVIIEVGDETRVATFDQVWPQQGGPVNPMAPRKNVKRTFNGDSAIGSKILAMSHKPFATILLTYYQPKVPPEMARRMAPPPSGPLPVEALQTMRRALIDARFEVKKWNLAAGGKMPEVEEGTPKVLIVLPMMPPSPMAMFGGPQQQPSFGSAEMAMIRDEIDSGTPAIFMAMYMPGPYGMPIPQYQYVGEYLRDEWGIDVQNSHILIAGVSNVETPGRVKLDLDSIPYLPVSTFTEHAIGKPLRGQRVFWNSACPIEASPKKVDGVKTESLLRVEKGVTNIWASKNTQRLGALFRAGKLINIDPDAGDLISPLNLAMAATRTGDDKADKSGARIVVLGVGFSMHDRYVNSPILVKDKTGDSLADPPRANLDLVVNSAYWLSGREQFIAAGPARLKPIAAIGEGEALFLRILCLGVLPIGILLVGGAVHYARKH